MKSRITKIVAVLIVLAFAFTITGCNRSELTGTWKATGYKINDEVQPFGDAGVSEIKMSVELTKDGKAITDTNGSAEEGTWEKDDNGDIRIVFAERTETLIREDNMLLMGSDTAGYIVFEQEK